MGSMCKCVRNKQIDLENENIEDNLKMIEELIAKLNINNSSHTGVWPKANV